MVVSLQVYCHSQLIHAIPTVKTKPVVSDTASKFYQTPLYHRPILSFQLAPTSLSQELSRNPAWASCKTTSLIKRKQLSD
jgi:hypothetical protein